MITAKYFRTFPKKIKFYKKIGDHIYCHVHRLFGTFLKFKTNQKLQYFSEMVGDRAKKIEIEN